MDKSARTMPRLTTHSTGLAISLPFAFDVDCSPVNSTVRPHLSNGNIMCTMPNLSHISPKALVTESPIHGKGLFAAEPVAKARS